MHQTHRMRWKGLLIALLVPMGLIGLAGGTIAAASTETVDVRKTYQADEVALHNLAARVHVVVHDSKAIELRLTGRRERLARVQASVRDRKLDIRDDSSARRHHSAVHVERNVVITGLGGSSTVIIGNVDGMHVGGPGGEPDALTLHIAVPRGTPLALDGFSGNLDVADLDGPVRLELLAGTARLGRVQGAVLTIVGSGEVEARRIDRELRAVIAGTGDIVVHEGTISMLTLETNGTASVSVGGRVERARLALNGVADVRVAHVEQPPEIDANGVINLDIGNW